MVMGWAVSKYVWIGYVCGATVVVVVVVVVVVEVDTLGTLFGETVLFRWFRRKICIALFPTPATPFRDCFCIRRFFPWPTRFRCNGLWCSECFVAEILLSNWLWCKLCCAFVFELGLNDLRRFFLEWFSLERFNVVISVACTALFTLVLSSLAAVFLLAWCCFPRRFCSICCNACRYSLNRTFAYL